MYTDDMDKGIGNFLKYNNAVPIVLGILFLSTSATMAASPAVRDSVYASQTNVRSVDNSYIVSLDVDDYPFAFSVLGITEDDDRYYVTYDFDTVDVLNGVWRDVIHRSELTVDKGQLGSADLEAYVENEFAQILWHERERLRETKQFENKMGISQKVVATEHSGLIGKFIEPSEQRLDPYESTVNKKDPLYVKNPKPLVTWDENAEPEEEPVEPVRPREEDEEEEEPVDQCPDIEGIQASAEECAPAGGGGEEPPPEEPPAEEPPVEEPPAEEPPVEEPPVEEPPAEEPPVEEPPAGEGE